MGFVTAIVLVTIAMVLAIALVTTAPPTVSVPLAAALGLGLIASGVTAVRERRLALRRRAGHERP